MEQVYLDCLLREEIGKSKIGALRKNDFVPAVVYGRGEKTLTIKCNRSQLIKFLHAHHGGENIVITLRVSDSNSENKSIMEKPVLIKDMQYDPLRDDILHIDFHQISLTEKIKTKIPIESKGEAIGVKKEGGILAHILWELEIECLPTEIPEKIEVDVSNLAIGQSIQVGNLNVPEGIKVLSDQEGIVFMVEHPKKVEEVVAPGAVEAEAGVAAAPTEPEVIKKEKKEKEEEAIEEGAPKATPKEKTA